MLVFKYFRVIILFHIWILGILEVYHSYPIVGQPFFSPKIGAILLDSTQAPLDLLRITSQSTSSEAKQSER